MKIAFGCDHGGLKLKNILINVVKDMGYKVLDFGTYSEESCHYPVFAKKAAHSVADGESDFGVLVCTTGEGIMMTANKIKGVRCGLAYDDEVAALMRRHNDANMISFGQKFIKEEDAIRRLKIFLETDFEGGRHQTRVEMIEEK